MLEIEVQHFCCIEVFDGPTQLICNHRCYLSDQQSSKFWCLYQPLHWCLSLSCSWSMTPWSNCTPKMGTKFSGLSWCTSLCVHYTQLCSDEGTLVSRSPLTTGYEVSLATSTHQKRCPNHQACDICFFMKLIKPCTERIASATIQISGILRVSICRVDFLTLHLFFISKTVQLGSHQKAVHPPLHIPQAAGLVTGRH